MPVVDLGTVKIGSGEPLCYIGGPCALETEEVALRHARRISEITSRVGLSYVFKGSYDKANRMRLDSPRGPGLERGLAILSAVKQELGVPVLTDVHHPEEAEKAAEVADVLQIPAFLCRQTDLVIAAARTGRAVNIKKGQFMAPWDMEHIAAKAVSTGNRKVLLTERGTTFGYGFLVNDMRAIPILRGFGFPVVFDAGHSVQQPGLRDGRSGGMREMIPVLARAGVAAGADAVFLECHEEPDTAPSDGPNMLALKDLEGLLRELQSIQEAVSHLRRPD